MALEHDDGQPYEMLECNFVKPGKGQALYKTRLRNLLTGTILDITYRSGDSLELADVRNADGMYSYFDGTNYIFMPSIGDDCISWDLDCNICFIIWCKQIYFKIARIKKKASHKPRQTTISNGATFGRGCESRGARNPRC